MGARRVDGGAVEGGPGPYSWISSHPSTPGVVSSTAKSRQQLGMLLTGWFNNSEAAATTLDRLDLKTDSGLTSKQLGERTPGCDSQASGLLGVSTTVAWHPPQGSGCIMVAMGQHSTAGAMTTAWAIGPMGMASSQARPPSVTPTGWTSTSTAPGEQLWHDLVGQQQAGQ
ncbi:UNVERIFIED_CONTAM: hypothetical protein K2H54_037014 [Gekko kuhli]